MPALPRSPRASRAPRPQRATLAQALAHHSDDVVQGFRRHYAVDTRTARQLFDDVKRWLWLYTIAPPRLRKTGFQIDNRLKMLDEMWHSFLLFTREYQAYCHALGVPYIHHAPTTNGMRRAQSRARAADPKAWRQARDRDDRAFYQLVFAELGEATLRRWYLEYPKRFGEAQIEQLRVKPARSRRAHA